MWSRFKNPLKAALLVVFVALCVWAIVPVQQKIRLGLDLQGGVQVILQLQPTKDVPAITSQVQSQVVQVIDNRINGLGVTEPQITRIGNDRILVELPAVKNPDDAIRALKDVAHLEFKIVPEQVATRAYAAQTSGKDQAYIQGSVEKPSPAYLASGPTIYSGAELKGAQAGYDQSGKPKIDFQTKNAGKFDTLTRKYLHQNLGIFLDGSFVSSPVIQSPIGESGEITGSFTEDDVVRTANELNAGALPVPVVIISNDTIGPVLGQTDLTESLYAAALGLGLVLVFMIIVYRLPGLLADLALVVYVVALLALLAVNKATLTLPGIAGFVLSIGMAVDANVLIFERLKEELWAGKTLRAAVRTGFARAFTTVFDSHVTTIVGAGVLFMLGTGTVKGFAYTLFWGTVFSLGTAVYITRFFMDVVVDADIVTSPSAYGASASDIAETKRANAVKAGA
ncbi:MAG: protein translocase subunit SecD [Vulcanimicrobiaceae bacterium]|jgi:preprotein translocase subunit SecD